MKNVYRLCFFAGLLFLAVGLFSTFFFLHSSLFEQPNTKKVLIHFKKGMSASHLVGLLSEQKALRTPFYFSLYLRFLGNSSNYQAGFYQLPIGITPKQLDIMLSDGNILQQTLTITEGQISGDIIKELQENILLSATENLTTELKHQCLLCQKSLEGMFLADTYFYPAGSLDMDLLLRAHEALNQALNKVWLQRQANLPYRSPYELLVAASIIEKETSALFEKPLVSAVIINRLNKNMRLQMDPTVIYGLGERYIYPLTRKALKIPTAYNTYRNKGLPPTPIANVGLSALKAAANPAKVDYLYFVAKKDGTHQFSHTLNQQTLAIKRIQKERVL